MKSRLTLSILLCAVWLSSSVGWACQVPVFRYALERWNAEQYRLVVMHREPLAKDLYQELLTLQTKLGSKNADVNVSLEVVNLSKLSEQAKWTLPDVDGMKSDPWIVLVGPDGKSVYSTAFIKGALAIILDSPARRQWVSQIVQGASVVWIMVEGDSEEQNQQASKTLAKALIKSKGEIKVPDGVMQPEDVPNANGDIDLEDVLRSRIPLKIDFPMMRVSRNDPKEAAFIAMLTYGVPDSVKNGGEAVLVPLFGRGRKLQALPASRLTEDLVLAGNRYLCGACSCQVKDNNPGMDIVIQEAWHKHLSDGLVVVDRELPPLEGVGDLSPLAYKEGSEMVHSMPPNEISTDASMSGFIKIISIIGGGVLVLLALGTWFVMKSKSVR